MPRTQRRQDLDVVADVNDQLIVFEVKSTHSGRRAGQLTRAGNLPQPRLRVPRPTIGGVVAARQGSQDYAAVRLATLIDVDDDFPGVEARAMVVDLKALLIQQFGIDDDGRITGPLHRPVDCTEACITALDRILRHRGRL